MLAIAILLLVLIIVCVIKRNRGGKYAVHERELAAGRGDYPEEGGFHEYSQPLDTKSAGGRASLASSSHQDGKHPESDTDSMAEYGDGDTGNKFRILYICNLESTKISIRKVLDIKVIRDIIRDLLHVFMISCVYTCIHITTMYTYYYKSL